MPTHQLKLTPTDVLFFKDGRPMEGASSGHGAAWPLPHILDSALHAALHRSGEESHNHVPGQSSLERDFSEENRSQNGRKFGSLQTSGSFPVNSDGHWYFPRPADADHQSSVEITHHPLEKPPAGSASSLPKGMQPVVNSTPPSKDQAEPWMSQEAYQAYLDGSTSLPKDHFLKDETIFAAEHNIGIAIDPNTSTQDGKHIYSASYLRLKNDWHIGIIAQCQDKKHGDLIEKIFQNSGHQNHIITGGQQRTCTVERHTPDILPLPLGQSSGFQKVKDTWLVKWTLLTPAIFPHLDAKPEKSVPEHPGGWLPTWICPQDNKVMLKHRPTREEGQSRSKWRDAVQNAAPIPATLVAAITGKPIPVTGWSLGHAADRDFGAKSTHLAVPAGSVYYFACDGETAAKNLAAALNWHGTQNEPTTIINRRSTLMGEKGFGLGVCSTWTYHDGKQPT